VFTAGHVVTLLREAQHELESPERKLEADQRRSQREAGKLSDQDLDVVSGNREQLEGKIQERYGFAKDQICKDIDDRASKHKL
jgi:uncharacterized protein YjbJ (UPF0337 family)